MNDFEYISSSEQLSAFLDGELDSAEAGKLFMELAKDPDLQLEMQDMINLRTNLQQLQTAPPQVVKDNIVAGLGIGVAGGAAAGMMGRGLWQSVVASKPFAMLVAGLVAAATTLFVVDYNKQSEPKAPIVNYIPPPSYDYTLQDQTPQIIEKLVFVSQPVIRSIEKIVYVNSTQASDDYQDVTEEYFTLNSSNLSPFDAGNINPDRTRLNISTTLINQNQETLVSKMAGPDFWKDLALQFRMQGQAAQSYPNPNIYSLSNPTLNNVGFALFYNIDKNNAIGIELGQENFLQVYDGKEFGSKVKYEQNYIGFWLGATYKYTFEPIGFLLNTQPIIQGTIGGTNIGPIAKMMLGLQYNFEDKIFVFGGIDGGTLLYMYQKVPFTSSKIGFSYGIAVRF